MKVNRMTNPIFKNPFIFSALLVDKKNEVVGHRYTQNDGLSWVDIYEKYKHSTYNPAEDIAFTLLDSGNMKTAARILVDDNLCTHSDGEYREIAIDKGFYRTKDNKYPNELFDLMERVQRVIFSTDFIERFSVLRTEIPSWSMAGVNITFYPCYSSSLFTEKQVESTINRWFRENGYPLACTVKSTAKIFSATLCGLFGEDWTKSDVDFLPSIKIPGNIFSSDKKSYSSLGKTLVGLSDRKDIWSFPSRISGDLSIPASNILLSMGKYDFPMFMRNEDNENSVTLIHKTTPGNYLGVHAKDFINLFSKESLSRVEIISEVFDESCDENIPQVLIFGKNEYLVRYNINSEKTGFTSDIIVDSISDDFNAFLKDNLDTLAIFWETGVNVNCKIYATEEYSSNIDIRVKLPTPKKPRRSRW